MTAEDFTNAGATPVVLWLAVGVAVVLLLMRGAAAFMPPLGDFLEKRRTIAQDAEDARIVDLMDQVRHLKARVGDLEGRAEAELKLLVEHTAWDYEVINALLQAGQPVPHPRPPLRVATQRKGSS